MSATSNKHQSRDRPALTAVITVQPFPLSSFWLSSTFNPFWSSFGQNVSICDGAVLLLRACIRSFADAHLPSRPRNCKAHQVGTSESWSSVFVFVLALGAPIMTQGLIQRWKAQTRFDISTLRSQLITSGLCAFWVSQRCALRHRIRRLHHTHSSSVEA